MAGLRGTRLDGIGRLRHGRVLRVRGKAYGARTWAASRRGEILTVLRRSGAAAPSKCVEWTGLPAAFYGLALVVAALGGRTLVPMPPRSRAQVLRKATACRRSLRLSLSFRAFDACEKRVLPVVPVAPRWGSRAHCSRDDPSRRPGCARTKRRGLRATRPLTRPSGFAQLDELREHGDRPRHPRGPASRQRRAVPLLFPLLPPRPLQQPAAKRRSSSLGRVRPREKRMAGHPGVSACRFRRGIRARGGRSRTS